jgi:hypothetical protein
MPRRFLIIAISDVSVRDAASLASRWRFSRTFPHLSLSPLDRRECHTLCVHRIAAASHFHLMLIGRADHADGAERVATVYPHVARRHPTTRQQEAIHCCRRVGVALKRDIRLFVLRIERERSIHAQTERGEKTYRRERYDA